MSKQVIFGCNGPVGVALMERLAAAGNEVVGVSRSGRSEAPEGVRIEAADVADVDAARRLADGASVLYCCAGLPYQNWGEQFPPIVDGLLAAAEAAEARLVFADNLYCYGPHEGPVHEDLPLTSYGRKPALRAQMVRTMLDAHAAGRARVTFVRASDFYGPRVLNAALGDRVFPSVLAGKSAQVLGDPSLPHTFTYVPDFSRALETLGGAGDYAFGQAWHVPNAPALPTGETIGAFGQLAGVEVTAKPMPPLLLNVLALFMPLMREVKEMMYLWNQPFEVDHSKFADRFWDDFTPLAEGLQATLEWYRSRPAA